MQIKRDSLAAQLSATTTETRGKLSAALNYREGEVASTTCHD